MKKLLLLLFAIVAVVSSHAQNGTKDSPFSLEMGTNSVPAEAGTYYYYGYIHGYNITVQPVFTMTDEMKGSFAVYETLPSDDYSSGSLFDGMRTSTFPFTLTASRSYVSPSVYVVIVKTESTASTGSFTVGFVEPGHSADNPIELTNFPYDYQVWSSDDGCELYFNIQPLGVEYTDRLAIVSRVGSGSWNFCNAKRWGDEITILSSSSGTTATAHGMMSYDMTGCYYVTVKVKLNGYSSGEHIRFYLANAGEDCVNAIEATSGTNTFPRSGTLYYSYTPTLADGSLHVFPTPAYVSDPSSGTGSLDTYAQGMFFETYNALSPVYMKFSATRGESFDLSEFQTPKGATNHSPFEVSADTTLFADGTPYPDCVWIKYTAPEAGYLTVTSNALAGLDMKYAPYSYYASDYQYTMTPLSYKATGTAEEHMAYLGVRKDDCYMFRCYLGTSGDKDHSITFKLEESEPCDTWQQAYILGYGQTIDMGTVSNEQPAWLKIESEGGDLDLVCASAAKATVYFGDVTDDSEPVETFSFTTDDGCDDYTDADDSTVSGKRKTIRDTQKGTYYVRLDSRYSTRARISLLTGTPAAIRTIATDATSSSDVYNLAGQRIASSHTHLPAGIYVIGGRKIVVK